MLSFADESIHGLAVEIPTNHREIPGSTPGRYNLQIEITSEKTRQSNRSNGTGETRVRPWLTRDITLGRPGGD